MGSVEDLEVLKKPTKTRTGVGRFHFQTATLFLTEEMLDYIKGEGEALRLTGAYRFEKLEAKSIRTHHRGFVDERGKLVRFKELSSEE